MFLASAIPTKSNFKKNKLFENLTSLSIFTLQIKPFLWKYHVTYPFLSSTNFSIFTVQWIAQILAMKSLFTWTERCLLQPFSKLLIRQNLQFLKLKCSAFIQNTSFTGNWKGRLKKWVFVLSVRILGNILHSIITQVIHTVITHMPKSQEPVVSSLTMHEQPLLPLEGTC